MISVSTSAADSLMRIGMLDSPSPGNSITIAPMRANTSMKVAASTGRSDTSMRMTQFASAADDSRRYPHHVTVQRVRHERQRQYQRHEDREDLRHEHQRLFLDLGQRLKQRHHDADHEADDHQGRRHHDDGPDRIPRHVEGFSTGHFQIPVSSLPSLRGALATKQSSFGLRRYGLLRCARNDDQIGIFMMSS